MTSFASPVFTSVQEEPASSVDNRSNTEVSKSQFSAMDREKYVSVWFAHNGQLVQ
jgi:hypothetical protein